MVPNNYCTELLEARRKKMDDEDPNNHHTAHALHNDEHSSTMMTKRAKMRLLVGKHSTWNAFNLFFKIKPGWTQTPG